MQVHASEQICVFPVYLVFHLKRRATQHVSVVSESVLEILTQYDAVVSPGSTVFVSETGQIDVQVLPKTVDEMLVCVYELNVTNLVSETNHVLSDAVERRVDRNWSSVHCSGRKLWCVLGDK